MKLRRKTFPNSHADADVSELRAALNRAGYEASDDDIRWAWEMHSEDWAAGWLTYRIHGEEADVKYLLQYLEPALPEAD